MTQEESRLRLSILAGAPGLAIPVSASAAPPDTAAGAPVSSDSFYSLKTTTLTGKPADLSQYAGKVTLVVNVPSKCGYTPQYKGLEALHQELQGKGFSVLGFPSNDFGGQEPGSAEEIESFCQKNYGVSFPLFSKLVTKAGPDQSPV
jgi:glutathione peroxidase